jgi:hypothetical protein
VSPPQQYNYPHSYYQSPSKMSAKLECYLCDIQTELLTWTEGYGGVYLCQPCKVKTDNECGYCDETDGLKECYGCRIPMCEDCVKHYDEEDDGYLYYCEQCWVNPSTTPPYNPFDEEGDPCAVCDE